MHINIQSKWINQCAKTTFGVYLLHENSVVRIWIWNEVFAIQNYVNTAWFVPVSILSVIITFLVCSLIDYLRQICIEPWLLKGMKIPKISACLLAIDDKMPESCVRAQEGTKRDPIPALVLLSASSLYFVCEQIERLTEKAISYKLFLFVAVISIVVTAGLKAILQKKRNQSKGN